MKLESNTIPITSDLLEMTNLGSKIEVLGMERLIALTKGKMTAMDIIHTIDSLTTLRNNYLDVLADCCGTCDGCKHCDTIDFEPIALPKGILQVAGIPVDAKLMTIVDEEGVVRVQQADYDYDIADVPPSLIPLMEGWDICLGELDALLMKGDVIYG